MAMVFLIDLCKKCLGIDLGRRMELTIGAAYFLRLWLSQYFLREALDEYKQRPQDILTVDITIAKNTQNRH